MYFSHFSNAAFFDVRKKKTRLLGKFEKQSISATRAAERLEREFMFYFSITNNEHLALTPRVSDESLGCFGEVLLPAGQTEIE